MVRVWSAVQVDGKVFCEIVDTEAEVRVAGPERDPARRTWGASVLISGVPVADDIEHSSPDCGPVRPCDACHAEARSWWKMCERKSATAAAKHAQVPLFGSFGS